MTVAVINKDGLKEFVQYGAKNKVRRHLVGNWLLKELYHEQIEEPQTLFKVEPPPITLSPAQMDEIAYKVLALIGNVKPDEDRITERVLEKLNARMRITL